MRASTICMLPKTIHIFRKLTLKKALEIIAELAENKEDYKKRVLEVLFLMGHIVCDQGGDEGGLRGSVPDACMYCLWWHHYYSYLHSHHLILALKQIDCATFSWKQ